MPKHRRQRHGVEGAAGTARIAIRPVGPCSFIVEEEKCLFVASGRDFRNGNVTADVAAELIELQICPGLTVMVAEPIVGVVIRIAVELIGRAVEVFATALGVDQNHDARTTPVLGVEVAGEGLEFPDGVEAQRGIFAVVRAYVGVDDAVEKEIVCRTAHPIDVEVIGLVEDQPELRIVVGDNCRAAWSAATRNRGHSAAARLPGADR